MAHIFKKPSNGQNGIIVLSHQETGRIENNPDLYPMVNKLLDKYFIGVHYGGFSFGAHMPQFCHFYMGRDSVTDIKQRFPGAFHIPMASAQFTSTKFSYNPDVSKYWDIINVSRNAKIKKLDTFFQEVKKIYEAGYKYKILLVCASRKEETEQDHFVNIADVYYEMFTDEEREWFTLLRLSKDLEFKGLSKTQLAYLYQASKVSTLFSPQEGSPGVIPEALLTKLPVVTYKHQQGSGLDFLDNSNSILFENYEDAHHSLIEAVENYDKFNHNMDYLIENYREDKGVENIKTYFKKLYEIYNQQFDGELINTDDLVSRLPAHYVKLPWANKRFVNGHMTEMEQFKIFEESTSE